MEHVIGKLSFHSFLFCSYFEHFRELLRGPLYYVLILILSALAFWRDSPVGVISVSMMCGGDGMYEHVACQSCNCI